MFKTLVLSGGAYNGLIELGVLHKLFTKDVCNINNIERIYGTSVGGLLAVLIALKLDWNDLCEYFIGRPWHKLLSINPIDIYTKKGAFDSAFFENALSNLFTVKGLNISNITLKDFKIYSGIDIFLYTIHLSTFELIEISHETHPELMLKDAITMTCGLPIVFRPVEYKGDYYLDGGIIANYPLHECLNREKNGDLREILGITFDLGNSYISLSENSTIAEYIYCLFNKISTIRKFNCVSSGEIPNEIIIKCDGINISDGYEALFKREKRSEMVDKGYDLAEKWITTKFLS